MSYNEERILNARKLIFYILQRWKLLVLFLIIGGGILGGTKLYKDNAVIIAMQSNELQDINTIQKRLSDEELKLVTDAAMYHVQLQRTKEYMDSSLLMSLDATKLEITNIQLMVQLDADYTQGQREELINNIILNYYAYVDSGMLVQDIYDDIKEDIPKEYIQELVCIEDVDIEYNASFLINIKNVEPISGMGDLVITAITNYSKTVNKSIAPHTLKLVNIYTGVKFDNELYLKQQDLLNTIYNYTSRMTSVVNSFSNDQKSYYNNLLGIADKGTVVVDIQKPQINLMYVLLGAVLGVFGACFMILIKYMLSGYLVSETDYITMFGLKYLGMVFEDKEKAEEKASFIKKLEYGDNLLKDYKDNLSFIALKIKLACKSADIKKVALVSSHFEGLSKEICADLCNRMKKEEIELICLEDVLTDGTAMCTLFDIGNCVLIEKVEHSKITDIRNVMELCNENRIQVMGVIDLK